MKKFWGRRLLVGLIVLTTAFSGIGTAVATAADGEEAIYSVNTDSLEASQEASIFLIHHHVMDHFPGEMDMKTYLIILPSLI